MSGISKRNAYLISIGWWLTKRRLQKRAQELVAGQEAERKRGGRMRFVLVAALAGGIAYVVARRRGDQEHGWVSYQPADLNGSVATEAPPTVTPSSTE
jgi:hypothetical protein